ncbi:hypothetical protein TNIN_292041 [Trichonephila inaurata madagascariensis]|uniref:Uncharacterized protein n=1 Tax=Trichonephila inaurata madagascariensis TaxID=2747483 RepID=A0A8X6WLN9_9ARAC|nr:hypothetical protein TNIN_292041 [Trichonephila inaurata madagascariensis]
MDLTSSSHLTWGRFLNRFRSIPTSLWPPPAKSSAPCACSEPWVHFRENFTKQKRSTTELQTAETPEQRQSRLQEDQVHHRVARAAEHLSKGNHVSMKIRSTTELPEQLKHLSKGNHVSNEDQVRHRVSRAVETPIQHVVRLLGLRKQRNVAITLKWKATNA